MPVRLTRERPMPRAALILPAVLTGLAFGLLVFGAAVSMAGVESLGRLVSYAAIGLVTAGVATMALLTAA